MQNKKDEVDALFQRTLEKANKTADRAALFFQCVVFYSEPISEELEVQSRKIRRLLKVNEEPRFTFPYYSSDIFKTEAEAMKYFPIFIQELKKKKMLPPEAFKSDTELDETRCKAALAPLTLAEMELKDEMNLPS
ncbi:MAG: hypothetical protein IKK93_07015 [Campylobacter sp.]|nr:hypothetical protein [Campylobacter sp.]